MAPDLSLSPLLCLLENDPAAAATQFIKPTQSFTYVSPRDVSLRSAYAWRSFQVRDLQAAWDWGIRGVPIPGKVLSPSVSLPGLESGCNLLPLVVCISLFKNLLFSWFPFSHPFPPPPLLCLLEIFLVCLIPGGCSGLGDSAPPRCTHSTLRIDSKSD